MSSHILITHADAKIYISPLDVNLIGCNKMGSHGGGVNKTAKRKAPKRCTFSPDGLKTSMELNCSVEMRMAKRSIFYLLTFWWVSLTWYVTSFFFIGRVYNSMRNGTYPLMFIGRIYNSMRNETYPLMFIGRIYNSMRNGTCPLMFIGRIYNSMRNGTYPLMFIGRVYTSMRNGTH